MPHGKEVGGQFAPLSQVAKCHAAALTSKEEYSELSSRTVATLKQKGQALLLSVALHTWKARNPQQRHHCLHAGCRREREQGSYSHAQPTWVQAHLRHTQEAMGTSAVTTLPFVLQFMQSWHSQISCVFCWHDSQLIQVSLAFLKLALVTFCSAGSMFLFKVGISDYSELCYSQ